MDFLADDPERDAAILARFGQQVAELVRRDRQQNVRRASAVSPCTSFPWSSEPSTSTPSTKAASHAAGSSFCPS